MLTTHPESQQVSSTSLTAIKKNQLQWILLLRLVLYSLLLSLNFFLRDSTNEVITLPAVLVFPFLLTIYSTTIVSSILLKNKKSNISFFALKQTCIDILFAGILIYFTGCSQSIYLSVLFFPVVTGGFILTLPKSIIPATLAALTFASMHFVEYFHLLPKYLETKLTLKPQSLLTIVHSFSVQTLTFFLVSLLSILLALRLQQTESALSDSLKDFKNLTELYKQIFNNISTGIITIDPQLIITSANQSSQNILGMTSSQLIQKKISDILPNINLTQMHTRLALSYSSPAGQQLRIGYSHMLLPRSEHEIPNDNGVNHRILTLQDITEVEKLEAQVRQSEKLAAIGTMSASIAHDFRNPLTAINGSAQILISEIANSKELDKSNYELCNIILRESTRLTDTISDFLKFSRPEIAKCSWFSLRNCVNEVIEVCRAAPQWPSTCEISIEIEKNLDIWADQNQLFVIFDHLIDNALSFCPKGNEKLEIIAQETTLSGETFIEIIFRDNGPGIPSEQRAKILEPFHTTRADGTGLGLSIIRQNMKEHKGSIQIGNSENGGAEFKLLFPIPDY